MKRLLSIILVMLWVVPMKGITNLGMEIPKGTYDIIYADSLPYAVFLQKNINLLSPGTWKASLYSLETEKELWSIRFKIGVEHFKTIDSGILVFDDSSKKTKLYDYQSGKILNKYKVLPTLIDEKADLIIGYQGKGNDKLLGYRISTGEQLWKTKIEKNYGDQWRLIKRLDSITEIVHGDHLWKLNLLTGDRQEYKLRRRIFDKKTNALNVGVTVLSVGLGVPVNYNASYFEDLGSDVLLDGEDRMYVADRDAVTCLDNDLNEIWSYSLPEGIGSQSVLYVRGDTLDMLNSGIGTNFRGEKAKVGKPFFASFDKTTGRNINILRLPDEFDTERYGKLLYFVTNPIYRFDKDKEIYSLVPHRGDCYPVWCENGDLVYIDYELNVLDTLPSGEAFFGVGETFDGEVTVGWKDGKFPYHLVVSPDGHPLRGWFDE